MNNAGIAPAFVGDEDVSDEIYPKMMDVNLNSVFWCCRTFGKTSHAAFHAQRLPPHPFPDLGIALRRGYLHLSAAKEF